MLPNSLSSLNAYTGLWSHLTSMDHTLDRVIRRKGEVTELDQEILKNTKTLLMSFVSESEDKTTQDLVNDLVLGDQSEIQFGEFDILELLKGTEFPATTKRFDQKVKTFANAIDNFLVNKGLFVDKVPVEFESIQKLIQILLAETEHSMT